MPTTTEQLMSTTASPITTARANRVAETRQKIVAVAANATAADRETVRLILAEAARGEYSGSKTYEITPGVGALLFLEHNPHNRDWDSSWSLELARRQRANIWRKNNEVPGFYKDGKLADGQHRFAACALSGVTWTTVIVFGMDRNAITTVDAGRRRDAASALKMDGMRETKLKQTVIKNSASYMAKLGDETAALRSEVEIADAIQANDGVLETAIDIAGASESNLVNPVLNKPVAATVAYLGLTHGWPEQRVREKLALFQTGQSSAGEQEPFFLAGQIIEKARQKSDAKDRLSTTKEVGLVVHALRLSTQGVRATTKAKMWSAIKTDLPKVDYPGDAPVAEAAE
jgi:hypothetical protein